MITSSPDCEGAQLSLDSTTSGYGSQPIANSESDSKANNDNNITSYNTAKETKALKAEFHLDLENFDREDVPEDCPYVLTSPRSLEACKRLRVKVKSIRTTKGTILRVHTSY